MEKRKQELLRSIYARCPARVEPKMIKKLDILGLPARFHGKVRLPPSKSYLHRALFVAALGKSESTLTSCGSELADDILATIDVLSALGVKIRRSEELNGTIEVQPGKTSRKNIDIYARGSGTTARFAISFAALAGRGTKVTISGDDSLTTRPMQSVFESLGELGVRCSYKGKSGKLPIIVQGGGISGGECSVDGSISSQFISSLLISCTKAKEDCVIKIRNPRRLVSKPYIDATLSVLSYFDLDAAPNANYTLFRVKGNQSAKARKLKIPGDMSAAAALIGATLASGGITELRGADERFPQADAAMIPIARRFGSKITQRGESIKIVSESGNRKRLNFNLKKSPDIVPVVAGLAAALAVQVKISSIGHLRFKESDRISVLSRELGKLGVHTLETSGSLKVVATGRSNLTQKYAHRPILINPEKDHRMLMALAIAGLSGRYGEILISDPDCVRKSYPDFVMDLQELCHEKNTVKIVEVSR
jgi:3-phosphoshikimate 1-carboxyvinyltransferase